MRQDPREAPTRRLVVIKRCRVCRTNISCDPITGSPQRHTPESCARVKELVDKMEAKRAALAASAALAAPAVE